MRTLVIDENKRQLMLKKTAEYDGQLSNINMLKNIYKKLTWIFPLAVVAIFGVLWIRSGGPDLVSVITILIVCPIFSGIFWGMYRASGFFRKKLSTSSYLDHEEGSLTIDATQIVYRYKETRDSKKTQEVVIRKSCIDRTTVHKSEQYVTFQGDFILRNTGADSSAEKEQSLRKVNFYEVFTPELFPALIEYGYIGG